MQTERAYKKVVLAIAGHDPTGAAGIQADIESIAAAGCQCVSIITALTIQNTAEFIELIPQQADQFRQQCQVLLSDIKIDACKIGLIGDLSIAESITDIIDSMINVPVVFDPVLNAGAGKALVTGELSGYLLRELSGRVNVLTPNFTEARQLTGHSDVYRAGEQLLAAGCPHVLVTGADEKTAEVTNILFSEGHDPVHYSWKRLSGIFHGSGCTLSSAIAANLANGIDPASAIEAAQEYTWKSLQHGQQFGHGQTHPDRFHDE